MKERNHLFSEFFIIFSLRETVNEVLHCAVIFQEKAEMLKKHFFSEELQANYNDMKKTVYFSKMKLLLQISAENIQDFIICQQTLSISEINSILNVFLQIMNKSFAEAVTKLT